ncbi:DUF296 domain-containing protein [uncultured Shewanella sp.]|uniref:PPC domain-containing DNA-binding protein n=1 Tax=uncultured Shewanella sp. TaxID=173975 RepID=UPI00261D30C5|nr:DUF296 domain-containing protein [uncultured Shewanella sp.]
MKTCRFIITFIAMAISISSYANEQQLAMGSAECASISSDKPFTLVLKKGSILPDTIIDCVNKAKIQSAWIQAIGALKNVDLAYYNANREDFDHKLFNTEIYELVSFTGNIALRDSKPFLHAHLILSDSNYNTLGGHHQRSEVGVTFEAMIAPVDAHPVRYQIKPNNPLWLIRSPENSANDNR